MEILFKNGKSIKIKGGWFDAYDCFRYTSNHKLKGISIITYDIHIIPLSNIAEIVMKEEE